MIFCTIWGNLEESDGNTEKTLYLKLNSPQIDTKSLKFPENFRGGRIFWGNFLLGPYMVLVYGLCIPALAIVGRHGLLDVTPLQNTFRIYQRVRHCSSPSMWDVCFD